MSIFFKKSRKKIIRLFLFRWTHFIAISSIESKKFDKYKHYTEAQTASECLQAPPLFLQQEKKKQETRGRGFTRGFGQNMKKQQLSFFAYLQKDFNFSNSSKSCWFFANSLLKRKKQNKNNIKSEINLHPHFSKSFL